MQPSVDAALQSLADGRRREIVRLVTHQELAAGEIAQHFDVTRPAVSQHLSVLKAAGLVSERRDGTRRLYRANPQALESVRSMVSELWASSLELAAAMAEDSSSEQTARQDAG